MNYENQADYFWTQWLASWGDDDDSNGISMLIKHIGRGLRRARRVRTREYRPADLL